MDAPEDAMQRVLMTTPIEDVRQRIYLETREMFADRLGITTQTYRRIVDRDPSVSIETRRQVAERLNTAPHLIPELIPPPSENLLRQIGDEIAEDRAERERIAEALADKRHDEAASRREGESRP